ncbi:hypothetical protein PUR56_07400 [Streptomyces sp. BE303]|nr:hypothetical protein [Streptomyces sp. BE303]
MRAPDISPAPRPAAYLCSPPRPRPPLPLGPRSRPRFETLVLAVVDGTHRLLLIPGPWVFSGGDGRDSLSIRGGASP